jgi:DNA-binding transcriptional MerR regulator
MRATGMSIEHIKQYIALCLLGDDTIPQRRKIILCQKEILEKHISEYKKLLNVVNKKLRRYDELEQREHAPQPEAQKAPCDRG